MEQNQKMRGTGVSSGGAYGWLVLAGLLIFLVSVLSFSDARAQSMPLTDQQTSIKMCSQKQTASTPLEAYRSSTEAKSFHPCIPGNQE